LQRRIWSNSWIALGVIGDSRSFDIRRLNGMANPSVIVGQMSRDKSDARSLL